MNTDLKIIKKMYGEKMMHLCRELFSTLLETEGLLSKLMIDNFAPSRFLYDDIIKQSKVSDFKNYIYSLVDVEKTEIITNKTPKELLEEIGYELYECKTESDIQSFKKYYASSEKLCTFNGGRLKNCHVFFAVKKNVEEIKRENFKNPERQDEYGTSVISIQFSRGTVNTLSIKNRYNHTVNNPDATFSNNLENIKQGLTESFKKTYNLNINQNENNGLELDTYVRANDGKYYKYNYEINNIYYCPNNIIIDNFEVKKYDKEKYIILDYFILDLQNNTIELVDKELEDSFVRGLVGIKKINIYKSEEKGNKQIEITTFFDNKAIIELDELNRIISYKNNELKYIPDCFLTFNEVLSNIELESVKNIKDKFLKFNRNLTSISFPNLKKVGNQFIAANISIKSIELPNLEEVGDSFLRKNRLIFDINFQKLKKVGNDFFRNNDKIKNLNLQELQCVGDSFFNNAYDLINLNLPKLEEVGDSFLNDNRTLKELDLPNLKIVGSSFLYFNECITKVNFPKLTEVGDEFLSANLELRSLKLPSLEYVGDSFLERNCKLLILYMPKLEDVGHSFLINNECLTDLEFPNLRVTGDSFLANNMVLSKLNLPNLIMVGYSFLERNDSLTHLDLPLLEETGLYFLEDNEVLEYINLPKLDKGSINLFFYDRLDIVNKTDIYETPIINVKKDIITLNSNNNEKVGNNKK